MKRYVWLLMCAIAAAQGPGRAPAEWVTGGSDTQRTHSIANDPKISVEGLAQPGFQFLWKRKLSNSGSLTEAMLIDRYIGYRGFRSLAFVAGADGVFAIDTDLNRLEWQKNWPHAAGTCAAVSIARSTYSTFPPFNGPGRSGFARSGVGEAHEGAVTIAAALRAAAAPAAPAVPRPPDRGPRPDYIYSISADGKLHAMYLSNGEEPEAPLDFLPANAAPAGLTVIGHGIAYAATHACNGAEAGVWAIEFATNQVMHWKPESGDIAGSEGIAFGPDGTIYAATTAGELVALDGRSLAVRHRSSASGFRSSPVVFSYKGRTMIAVAGKDSRIHLFDEFPFAPVTESDAISGELTRGALTSWQAPGGIRWLAATTDRGVTAWRIVERERMLGLEQAWRSDEMASPLTPMIINGVVLALSGGKSPAALYALEGSTGKTLWSSGKMIGATAQGGGLSGGSSQIYFSTNDGTIYAFGFPIEH